MKINFIKMHGLGNDFILIDCIKQSKLKTFSESEWQSLAKKLCNRRFGIGADQILLLHSSITWDFGMRIFNADGSEVEMCGNGIRCLARYIWDADLSNKDVLEIETLSGIIKPQKVKNLVKVDMGEPILEGSKIPVKMRGTIIDYPLEVDNHTFLMNCVSMGNPHAVIVVDDVDSFPVSYYGPIIENHPFFPKRTNVEFIQVLNKNEIKMRVWERGVGETLACGTGASAVCVASSIKDLTQRDVTIHLKGGDMFINWDKDNHVYMTGSATKIFEGTIEI